MHILFEDDLIIAVEKPSGIPSHTLRESASPPSVEWMLAEARAPAPVYLLHRLDTGTSGALLFAKNESIYNEMRNKFKLKHIKKKYLAWSLSSDEIKTKASKIIFPLTIQLALAHHPKSKKRMIALPQDKNISHRGKAIEAITILHSFAETNFQNIPALQFQVEIVTGVMHQIRVHMKSLGFPLIGDPIYGMTKNETPSETKVRMGLHASSIEFELKGKNYKIESPFQL